MQKRKIVLSFILALSAASAVASSNCQFVPSHWFRGHEMPAKKICDEGIYRCEIILAHHDQWGHFVKEHHICRQK